MTEQGHYRVTFITDEGEELSIVVVGDDELTATSNAYRAYRAFDKDWQVKEIQYLGNDID